MRLRPCTNLALALLCTLAFAACGDKAADKKPAEEAHEHKAPHGGEILELGNEEGHVEILHDEAAGTLTLYVYGSSLKKPEFVKAPTLSLQTKAGPIEVTPTAVDAKPDGTAHNWKAQHDGFKVDPLDGRIRLQIGGKSFQSPLEPAGHDHK